MAGQRLAELFVDITLRSGAKAEVLDLKKKIEATDTALANNAQKYQNVTSGKILQLNRLAERQMQLAGLDQRTYGKLPYAGYAQTQANADVETEIAGKQKMIALSKAELQALSGKRGLELAQKSVQAERVKKQVEEMKNQQMMIAQHGKIGATIRQNASLAKSALSFSPMGLLGVGAAGITAGHAISQASPVHMDMLGKSFDLLAAQIGTLLLPIVERLAAALQGAAEWAGRLKPPEEVIDSFDTGYIPRLLRKWGITSAFWLRNTPEQMDDQGKRIVNPTRPATMPAHFEAFDQTWKRIQQQAAGTGPLEQQILDVQLKNLEKLNQIAKNTTPGTTPPPPPPLPI